MNQKKLDRCVMDRFPCLMWSSFCKALRKKDIAINGKRVSHNVVVSEGDVITLYVLDSILFPSCSLQVVFEDSHILLLHKPVGIEVQGDYSLTSLAKEYAGTIVEPCHRLDRNTEGLILFAKDSESLTILLDKFRNHEIEKRYMAKVYGIPQKDRDTLVSFLFKDTKKSLVYVSDTYKKGYQKIITSYRIYSKNKTENTCLLDICIETGKTHQIRAHLAHLGYPIIGDGKYGDNAINKRFHQKTQMLFSYHLSFHFAQNTGILSYLDGKVFELPFPEQWKTSSV